MMTRENVTLVREVVTCNYDGITSGRRTEVIEAVIEWPDKKPDEGKGQYSDCSEWKIASLVTKAHLGRT